MLAAILTAHLLALGGHGQVDVRHYSTPVWRIDVRRDRFTGGIRCTLARGSRLRPTVAYAQEAVTFRFAPHIDTLHADFRIDDGPARSWDDVYPAVVRTGVTLIRPRLDNPTEGRVILPWTMLGQARSVTIRPTGTSHPRRFAIDGLGEALAAASRLGCDPRTGFDAP